MQYKHENDNNQKITKLHVYVIVVLQGGADNSTDADGCTAAWSKINRVKEKRGCVGKKLIKRYVSFQYKRHKNSTKDNI